MGLLIGGVIQSFKDRSKLDKEKHHPQVATPVRPAAELVALNRFINMAEARDCPRYEPTIIYGEDFI